MADMTESSLAADQESDRYPLSFTQEWFVTLDKGEDGGTFGPRFLMVRAMRVTGPVDLGVLQGSLDDVVARHELLRTLVVRDADPRARGSRAAPGYGLMGCRPAMSCCAPWWSGMPPRRTRGCSRHARCRW